MEGNREDRNTPLAFDSDPDSERGREKDWKLV